ncbi:MAG: hypothetical protein JW854_14680 [Actinobacteria bacterium]|nr:hypothetical protein [Actinomycetota bacterium]
MILVLMAYMYVFCIIFFSVLALTATGYLVSYLVKRGAYGIKPAKESRLPRGIRPAYY